jgi:hypothetical protein
MLLMKFAFPRHRGMRFPALVTALLIATGQALAQTPTPQPQFHATYPVSPTKSVRIRNVVGSVRVTAWDRPEVKVDAVKSTGTTSKTGAEIVVESDSNGLCIESQYAASRQSLKQWLGVNAGSCDAPQNIRNDAGELAAVDYTISVPREAPVTIFVGKGDVAVEGTGGNLYVAADDGRITLHDLAGESQIGGTQSIAATFTSLPHNVNLSSSRGPVVVYLASDIAAQVHVETRSGRVQNDFGWPQRYSNALQGHLGSGGEILGIGSVDGRVEIRRLPLPQPEQPATKKAGTPPARKKAH